MKTYNHRINPAVKFIQYFDWSVVSRWLLIRFVIVMLAITIFNTGKSFWCWHQARMAETPTVYKSNTTGEFTLKYPDGRVVITNIEPERSNGEYVITR